MDETRRAGQGPGDQQEDDLGVSAGAFLGREPEWAAESIKDGPQRGDERVAGEATQSLGPAKQAANPDAGWERTPEGHRHAETDADEVVRRAGDIV